MERGVRSFFLLVGILVIGLGLVVGWAGYRSIAQQAAFLSCEILHESAGRSFADKDWNRGLRTYAAAVKLYRKCDDCSGFGLKSENGFLVIGNCYCGLGQYMAASEYYKKGLKYAPYSVALYSALGGCAVQTGEFAKALSYYEKSWEIFPYDRKLKKAIKNCRMRMVRGGKDGS